MVLIDNISYLNTFVSCGLVTSFIGNYNPQSIPKSGGNIFQSILFKHTSSVCKFTKTEPKISSDVNYQINFKGLFFSLNYFSCRQGDS